MEKIRTFIAVHVSPEVTGRATDLIHRLQKSQATVSWVKPDNLHLTLKFLGDVPNIQVGEICQAVIRAARDHAPFDIACRGAGAFPDVRRPRTLWLGVAAGSQPLIALHDAVDAAVHELGFPRERRRFHPHLTIGRVRQGGPTQRELSTLLEKDAEFEAGLARIEEVLIYASFLEKTGPTYDVLGRARLNG